MIISASVEVKTRKSNRRKMNKNAILFAVVLLGCLAVAQAKFDEENETKSSMSDAYQTGKNFFSSLSKRGRQNSDDASADAPVAPKKAGPFSHYTAKLVALGGGKPRLADQYRHHNYVPLPPVKVPVEFPSMHDGLTPEIAAEIYKPRNPLGYSSDEPGIRI